MQERVLRVVGEDLRISEGGEGLPLVFLHGAGGPNWNPMLRLLAARFRVIAPHHPGFGGSRRPDWLNRPGDLAFFYLDVLAALGLARAHLVGHSLGGWIAAEMGIRNTSRLASITLLAPAGVPNTYGRILHWGPDDYAAAQFHDQSMAAVRAAFMRAADPALAAANRANVRHIAGDPFLHDPALPVWLHRIDVPTLVFWGESDRICDPAGAATFAREIPGATLQIVPELGHSVHSERPELAADAITAFISGVA